MEKSPEKRCDDRSKKTFYQKKWIENEISDTRSVAE
jgi:hypothetical protein